MEKVAEGLKIVGVSRGNEFSPNHVGNDAAPRLQFIIGAR